ncbi:OmpH family outer membrane protein [Heliomarina baculiformis]|uniref:OmpH family outer membrane protein n=1 Tax=Heliomarina baculiformis TaxID=2872036 RepID=UPI001EE3340A|nr:OmpH family outer membrane protein [Heliomarina baculiformis]
MTTTLPIRLARAIALASVIGGVFGFTPWAGAQQLGFAQTAILTISSERLFNDSAFGKRIDREIETEGEALAEENNRIAAELTAEEHELTEKRADMDPEAFRELADAFDEKVQKIRGEQDHKTRVLAEKNDKARAVFLNAVRPILAEVMRESGAGVILERSSVFLSANATDITDLAIERIDATIGDGSELSPAPDQ